MVKKKASQNGTKNGSNGKNVSSSAVKRNAKNSKNKGGIGPLIGALIILVLIVTVILLLRAQHDEYPVTTTEAAALDAFRNQGVSEIIAPDLANDFASGNYTLAQLVNRYPGYDEDIAAVDAKLRSADSDVVVIVNGDPITEGELDLQLNLLPDQYKQQLSKEEVLSQMIDERLLLQEASKRGIAVTEQDIDAAYQELLTRGNLSEEQLAANLDSFGLTTADLRTMLFRQLTVDLLFRETVNESAVSDAEAQSFYDENQELFTTPPQVTVRHILIALSENRTTNETTALAKEALARYEAGEDFCALVQEYSDDAGSKDTCGEYTFPRGFMVPAFENASFDMAPNETRLVDTVFGTHLILKMADIAASVQPYADVKDAIMAKLTSARRSAAYKTFIDGLRADADIVFPRQSNETAVAPNESVSSNDVPPTAAENLSAQSDDVAEPPVKESPIEKTPVEKTPSMEQSTISVTVGDAEATVVDDLASCLKNDGAILYTADWATASLDEARAYADMVTVLDCTGKDQAACATAGVDAYPTWFVGNALHAGRLSEGQLAAFAGC